jgi:putative ABC transport system substrate-binding protein
MRRREFLGALGGAATWPVVAHAQPTDRVRRVGALMPSAADDPQWQPRMGGVLQGLQQAGWTVGRNVQIDFRWNARKADDVRKYATELIALAPDVIFAAGGPTLAALQQVTRTLPIVFVNVADPVAAGFVDSLARPGGNITGFMNSEYGISGKWLELLKQIAPGVTRVAVIRDLANRSGLGQFGALQGAAPSFGVELIPIGNRDVGEIERGIAAFARGSNGGMIVPQGAAAALYREPLIMLAARHRLPAVYSDRAFVSDGGLLSYGPDRLDSYRRAAGYVDRILKGEKPADLPVQAPTKYELVINLKTAKTLGLDVPLSLQQRADEVIE